MARAEPESLDEGNAKQVLPETKELFMLVILVFMFVDSGVLVNLG